MSPGASRSDWGNGAPNKNKESEGNSGFIGGGGEGERLDLKKSQVLRR